MQGMYSGEGLARGHSCLDSRDFTTKPRLQKSSPELILVYKVPETAILTLWSSSAVIRTEEVVGASVTAP